MIVQRKRTASVLKSIGSGSFFCGLKRTKVDHVLNKFLICS